MKAVKDIIACVVEGDAGLYLPVAQRLARDCKQVLYKCGDRPSFPTIDKGVIGEGFENILRIDDVWDYLDTTDLYVFPDIGNDSLQLELVRQGKPVWGSKRGDLLEVNRRYFMNKLIDLDLPVPKYQLIIGLTKLREFLKDKTDKFIKISKYRGTMETEHWKDWASSSTFLDQIAVAFGPTQDLVPFVVCDKIDTPNEFGCDTYCVNGEWPSEVLRADEYKDKALIAAVTSRDDLPEEIKAVANALTPEFKKLGYTNFFSMELRDEYLIDPTCRGGLPSIGSQMELWHNFSEIIWSGANGELVDPHPLWKFSCECVLSTKAVRKGWAVFEIPKHLKQWVKIGRCCQIDGKVCIPKTSMDDEDVGWLVAPGDTPEEAIQNMLDSAKDLPDGLSAATFMLPDLLASIRAGESDGVKFSKQPMPKPEEAVAQ